MTKNSYDSIAAVISTGQYRQAEQMSRVALLDAPADENLQQLLAFCLQYQGRHAEAVPLYEQMLRAHPSNGVYWSNYASVLDATGQLLKARDAFARAIPLNPGVRTLLQQYGLLLIRMGDFPSARLVLLDAYDLARDLPEARIYAARACSLSADMNGAWALLRPWRSWLPMADAELQLELCKVLSMSADVTGSAEVLDDLVLRGFDSIDIRLLRAGFCERFNRLDEAEALLLSTLDGSVASSPEERITAMNMLATVAMRRNQPAAARQWLEQAGPDGADDTAHFFELAAAADKLGDTHAAMRALGEAHRRKLAQLSVVMPEAVVPGAPAVAFDMPQVTVESYRRWPQLIAPEAQDSPVFVVGFPRSGTTLLEQMLDAHPQLQSMDENPFFNRLADLLTSHDKRILDDLSVLRQYDADELRRSYYAMVDERVQRRPGVRIVDKNPLNTMWLPLINRLFPNARIILALRHPCDVILSCHMQDFRAPTLALACTSLDRLARGYVQVMQRWVDESTILQPAAMNLRYEDVVDDLPGQAQRIAQFLGLDDASPMLGFHEHARGKTYIGTPSYSQVIEPVNRKAMGRWQKYREWIEPVLPTLDPMLRHWGYEVDA
ncbi:tetratricopeptide repeat-containing sulfotransferase family protein [Dyella sp. C11]|uniref:tetratricopeptide repeat-containing sulfotransferase family protein n=1 Tax=Dyella sp. C11 TaxID=2126991 RepID=UPI0018E585AF|nr:tetratricopeptide repeat-containing sulfotransferase family protein [Dyella sp. C11]